MISGLHEQTVPEVRSVLHLWSIGFGTTSGTARGSNRPSPSWRIMIPIGRSTSEVLERAPMVCYPARRQSMTSLPININRAHEYGQDRRLVQTNSDRPMFEPLCTRATIEQVVVAGELGHRHRLSISEYVCTATRVRLHTVRFSVSKFVCTAARVPLHRQPTVNCHRETADRTEVCTRQRGTYRSRRRRVCAPAASSDTAMMRLSPLTMSIIWGYSESGTYISTR